jgi:hypothetical protein
MSAIPAVNRLPVELRAFLFTLGHAKLAPEDGSPPWFEPGVTSELDEGIYDYFRRAAPPESLHAGWFVIGSGLGPRRLFWRTPDSCFARELTVLEAQRFPELTGVTLIAPSCPEAIRPS